MVVCPTCGKENSQADAAYCLYCGSSLKENYSSGVRSAPSPTGVSGYGIASSGMTTPEFSERYEVALGRVEQMSYLVLLLAVAALVLFFL